MPSILSVSVIITNRAKADNTPIRCGSRQDITAACYTHCTPSPQPTHMLSLLASHYLAHLSTPHH